MRDAKLERSLKREGYKVLESENKDGIAIVQRNGRHSQKPNVNLFQNDIGYDRSRYDSIVAQEIKPNQVKVISTLYTTVAQKVRPQK